MSEQSLFSQDENLFYKIPQALAKRKDLTSTSKLIFGVLSFRLGKNETAWPGYGSLSKDTGITKNSAMNAIQQLEKAGLITKEIGERGKSNRYKFLTGAEIEPVQIMDPNQPNILTAGSQNVGPEKNQLKKIKREEEIVIPEKLAVIPSFGEAWAEWIGYRKQRWLSNSPMTLRRQLAFLAGQPNPTECIELSIRNGWQGLFELKGRTHDPKAQGGNRQFAAGNQQLGKFDRRSKTVISNRTQPTQPGL